MKNILIYLLLICSATKMQGFESTLYINSGNRWLPEGKTVEGFAFNFNSQFESKNAQFILQIGDSLVLTVVNNDSSWHGFEIIGKSNAISIAPGDSILVEVSFDAEGTWLYRDSYRFPENVQLGASGCIAVNGACDGSFVWHIQSLNDELSVDLFSGGSFTTSDFNPNYFLVNGSSYPQLMADSSAMIIGAVNDRIILHIANGGFSLHSLHFHGYHLKIIGSSANPTHLGREKDTFPVSRMSTLTLELYPHQPGVYPVHDHNLLGVLGNYVYPYGMLSMMSIIP